MHIKVMFVELNRDESQNYLDQMKQDLVSISHQNFPVQVLLGLLLAKLRMFDRGLVTKPNGSMNSFSGVYPCSRISPVARAPSPCGPYSNIEMCCFPRNYAGYNQTYGVIPMVSPTAGQTS
ncbi:hypothetical protein TanjilG_09046 [Lupinus angustifolius]|uniref:Uncharacterized protein n=1 Tax=Lupinus angustifolius TaxID=3871 RepID=A0A4P1QPF8_LUPAN|nr:hypothetical protein TanjilG_09046 [Lupinus angustifolius]